MHFFFFFSFFFCFFFFFFFLAEDVQRSEIERQGMTDFHVTRNKAPIVHPALWGWEFAGWRRTFPDLCLFSTEMLSSSWSSQTKAFKLKFHLRSSHAGRKWGFLCILLHGTAIFYKEQQPPVYSLNSTSKRVRKETEKKTLLLMFRWMFRLYIYIYIV